MLPNAQGTIFQRKTHRQAQPSLPPHRRHSLEEEGNASFSSRRRQSTKVRRRCGNFLSSYRKKPLLRGRDLPANHRSEAGRQSLQPRGSRTGRLPRRRTDLCRRAGPSSGLLQVGIFTALDLPTVGVVHLHVGIFAALAVLALPVGDPQVWLFAALALLALRVVDLHVRFFAAL